MSGGYRLLVIALGLVLAGAAPPPSNDGEQPPDNAAPKVERSLENMAASLREANKSTDLEKPCEEGDNKRSSDLCAQWKAADAAKSAAGAAWLFGLLGTLIGTLTLAAACAAAFFAKKAADHTETGANEAKRAADAAERAIESSERPHLLMERCDLNLKEPDLAGEYPLTFSFANKGSGPCWMRSWITSIRIADLQESVTDMPLIERNQANPWAIAPEGQWHSVKPVTFAITADQAAGVLESRMICTVFWSIRYTDASGREHAHDLALMLRSTEETGLVPIDHPFWQYT